MLRKRSHSFEDDLLPQSKIHVSDKEVNMGVNMDQNMQAVYEKTLQMLFKASPKKTYPEYPVTSVTLAPKLNTNSGRYKQLFLDSNCKLHIEGCLKEDQVQISCGLCGNRCHHRQICNFCEKYLCENCKRVCRKCDLPFCSSCIFSMYEGNDEFTICRSCY
ncbi:apoptosis regulatory protein Siva-like [Ischnura elegans]|uniref:apoptosis regulatory protein Siva-like n=1 Tax=Ischnura elegans TaxID=197161 RepID=UPI001ED8A2C2|nr:apoptosis regulatory protein Siva-like [Ischnura elegans]